MASTTGRKKRVTRKSDKNQDPLFTRIKNTFEDERVRVFTGLALILFAILLTISFGSFFYTWKQDYDILSLGWYSYFFDTSVQIENSVGKIGLLLSNIFIYNWFGVASFGFVFLLIIAGFRLLNVRILSLSKSLKYTLFLILWLSIILSFIFGDTDTLIGGKFGFSISSWLESLLGVFGTVAFLLIVIFTFLIFTIEGFLEKIQIFFSSLFRTRNVLASIKNIKKEYIPKQNSEKRNVYTENKNDNDNELEENIESENKGINIFNRKKEKKKDNRIVIDLDTNEPLETTNKRNYKLGSDGNEIDDELGFEVDDKSLHQEAVVNISVPETPIVTSDNEIPNIAQSAIGTEAETQIQIEKKYDEQGKLLLDVEQNTDVLVDKINTEPLKNYDPTLDLSNYKMPPINLLLEHKAGNPKVSKEELLRNKNRIVETLKQYKIEIQKIKATIGPTITLYEIIPAPGVRISKIKNLEDDIALSLSAIGIRIIAPMPGRGTIGIEVPNEKPEIVSMQSVIRSAKFQESNMELPIALGKTISNESYVIDLTKMPHILVAGATGQGKSVGLNAMITSILFKKHPAQVKFVLIDPKKVELTLYERLEKHYLATLPDSDEPIITDNQKVIQTVSSLNVEMDNRYQLLKKAKTRNIKEYNTKFIARKLNPNNGHKYLPYIVLVIDEFADLIMTAGKEIELPIARLAQLARAVGLHLIVATQRPSTNIITGVIKANFPARLAFKVASMIDSRTILDSPGANHLIGRGDMLMSQGSDLVRLQCAFIDTPELDEITEYIEGQQGYTTPFFLPEVKEEGDDEIGAVDLSKRDELFEDSARMVVLHQQGSTSLIQRKLSIGYNRAGRIVDQLEAAGIVGPPKGSKARDVYFADEYSLEQHLIGLL